MIDYGLTVDGDVKQPGSDRIRELGEEESDLVHPWFHREGISQGGGLAHPSRLEQTARDILGYRGM